MAFDEGLGLSTQDQAYDPTSHINPLRQEVDAWRALPNPEDWRVTPETARLLQHWRHHQFASFRPFFCQVEAAGQPFRILKRTRAPEGRSRVHLHDAPGKGIGIPGGLRDGV